MRHKVVIPCNPGIYALYKGEDGSLGFPAPVIAWEIIYDDVIKPGEHATLSAVPIVPGHEQNVDFLRYPDGRVEELRDGASWESLGMANTPENCEARIKA